MLQAKLLRVLQEKTLRRVGENRERPVNCRIISASHKDLQLEVARNNFREDLLFRLNVIPIKLPSLRERKEDIKLFALEFLKKFSLQNNVPLKLISNETLQHIMNQPWKGNVRELENYLERAMVLCSEDILPKEYFTPNYSYQESTENTFSVHHPDALPKLEDVVQKYIDYAVEVNFGAKDKTAKDLGIDRKTLYKRIKPRNDITHSQLTH